MIAEVQALLTYQAHIPHRLAKQVSLAKRYQRGSLLGLSIYKDSISLVVVKFKAGVPTFSDRETHQILGSFNDEEVVNKVRDYAEKGKVTDCVIDIAWAPFIIEPTGQAKVPDSEEEGILLMKESPEKRLGKLAERNKRHVILHHPSHNYAYDFRIDEKDVENAEKLALEAGLQVVRVQCSPISLCLQILRKRWDELKSGCNVLVLTPSTQIMFYAGERILGVPSFQTKINERDIESSVGTYLSTRLDTKCRSLAYANAAQFDLAAAIANHRACADMVNVMPIYTGSMFVDLNAVCLEDSYDLSSTIDEVRPYAPSGVRMVTIGFWGGVAACVIFGCFNLFSAYQLGAKTTAANLEKGTLDVDVITLSGRTKLVNDRTEVADTTREWLAISPSHQAILYEISHSLAPEEEKTADGKEKKIPGAVINALDLSSTPGLGQIQVKFEISSKDGRAVNEIFRRVATKLEGMGYKQLRDLDEPVPNQSAFRFCRIYNMPKASQ